jgi:uncharacterized protein YfaS (alpha-2-macroglobulin family)
MVILAMDAYAGVVGEPGRIAGLKLASLAAQAKGWTDLPLPSGLFPVVSLAGAVTGVSVENSSTSGVFYQVVQAGFDVRPPKEELKQKLEIHHEITDASGKPIAEALMGEEYYVHVRARAIGDPAHSNVAVVDLFPAGFEPVLERGASGGSQRGDEEEGSDLDRATPKGDEFEDHSYDSDGEEGAWVPHFFGSAWAASPSFTPWRPQFVDTREDRVVIYGSVGGSVQEYVYKVKAVNRGVFSYPPAFAESMYDRSVQARGLAGVVTVRGK